eukprot:8750610-Pyramimonas_sp.AAC.1
MEAAGVRPNVVTFSEYIEALAKGAHQTTVLSKRSRAYLDEEVKVSSRNTNEATATLGKLSNGPTPLAEAWNIPYTSQHRWPRPGMFPTRVSPAATIRARHGHFRVDR